MDPHAIPPQREPSTDVITLPMKASASLGTLRIPCDACERDWYPNPGAALVPPHHRVVQRLQQHVDLTIQTYVSGERSPDHEVMRETPAYVGRCERCGHTYIVRIEG